MSPEDIDKLSIAEVRAICERASEALRTLRELGLGGGVEASGRSVVRSMVSTSPLAVPVAPGTGAATSPFPCGACGRQFGFRGEEVKTEACDTCGLPIPATATYVTATNKGPIAWTDEENAAREMRRLEREANGG